jgi:DNA replication protein DnaC
MGFDQFDFERLPHLNRALVHELATGRYLDERVPVLIVGPCGTGKSHLAQALGHCAIRQGVDVLFTTCAQLVAAMNAARATGASSPASPPFRCSPSTTSD